MATMKALVTEDKSLIQRGISAVQGKGIGHGASVKEVAIPEIGPDEVLVKVHSVALNPTDYKHIDTIAPANSIIGCDYAGTVAKVGDGSAAKAWKVGDRIAGVTHGGIHPDRGSFAQFLKIDHDLAFKIPDGMSDRDATTYGVSAVTAMQGIYHTLDVPWPDASEKDSKPAPPSILIYAGSTAAGLFAIQMAKHAGVRVATTCSPHSFELVKKFGADSVYDYRAESSLDQLKADFPDLTCAFDGISEGTSTSFCDKALEKNGGKVVKLLMTEKPKVAGVSHQFNVAYTLMGREFQWFPPLGPKFAAKPDDRAALARFYAILPQLTGWLKPDPTELVEGGFDGLLGGLDRLRKGQVSGKKLVLDLA